MRQGRNEREAEMLSYEGDLVDEQARALWKVLKVRLEDSKYNSTRIECFAFYNGRER